MTSTESASATGGGASTAVRGSYDFDAPAEVVFGVLTDPNRTSRWLPRGMRTESAGTDGVRVRVGAGVHDFQVRVVPDELTVHWRAAEEPGPRGTATVSDSPAGGSVVHAEVELSGTGGADRDRVEDLLAEAVEHLRRDVSDNFNAG